MTQRQQRNVLAWIVNASRFEGAMVELKNYGWTDADAPGSADFLDHVVLDELHRATGGSGTVLELGAGNGAFARKLASIGYEVTAIEPSDDGFAQANKVPSQAHFVQASIYDDLSRLLDRKFDALVSTEVIEHLMTPKELFAQAGSLLKPGGTLIISTPYHGYLKNLAIALLGGWDRHFTVDWEGGHIKFFSKRTLAAMAEPYGFKRPRFRGTGRVAYLWKSMIMTCRLE